MVLLDWVFLELFTTWLQEHQQHLSATGMSKKPWLVFAKQKKSHQVNRQKDFIVPQNHSWTDRQELEK